MKGGSDIYDTTKSTASNNITQPLKNVGPVEARHEGLSPVAAPYVGLAWGKILVYCAVGYVGLRNQHVLPWTIRLFLHLSLVALQQQTACIVKQQQHRGRV